MDADIEIIKAQIGIIKNKQTERLMFRSRVKWHEEGEKNNAYFLGLMNSKYSRLELNKVTDNEGTALDKNALLFKVKHRVLWFYPLVPLLGGGIPQI